MCQLLIRASALKFTVDTPPGFCHESHSGEPTSYPFSSLPYAWHKGSNRERAQGG